MTTKEMITKLNQMAEYLADQEAYRWRDADQEKPPEGEEVLVCFSGHWKSIRCNHAYDLGTRWVDQNGKDEWELNSVPLGENIKITVHQWKRIEKPRREGVETRRQKNEK